MEPKDALTGKLKEVERLLAAIQAAESQGRWIRRLLVLAVVLFLVGFTWLFYERGKAFMSEPNMEKLSKAAHARMSDKHTQDKLHGEVQKLLANVREPVMDAFNKRMDQDSKRLVDRMNKEGDTLLNVSLPPKVTNLVTKHYEKVLMENQGVFEEEFPELTTEKAKQNLANSVATALSRLSHDMYADEIKTQSEQLLNTWRSFPAAPAREPDELEERMTDLLLELMWYQMGDLAPQKNSSPSKTPATEKKK